MKTLTSIIKESEGSEDFGVLIFIGDLDETYIGQIGSEIQATFSQHVERGQIEVISPPKDYYPDFDQVKTLNTFGDAPTRIHWRQKQNLGWTILYLYT